MDDQHSTHEYPSFPRGSSQDAAVLPRPVEPPSKAMAGWSLGLAFVPAPIAWAVSIGLGIAVLRRSRDGLDHGKGMVIAAFVLIAVWILAIVVVVIVSVVGAAERDTTTGSVTSRGDVPVTEIRTGDCVANEIREEVEMLTVELIPCEEPHYYEAFATFTLPDGDFPGQGEVDRLAEGGCVKRFEEFVGVSYDESELEFFYMRPFVDGWAIDRGVSCLLTLDNRTAGSLKDAAR